MAKRIASDVGVALPLDAVVIVTVVCAKCDGWVARVHRGLGGRLAIEAQAVAGNNSKTTMTTVRGVIPGSEIAAHPAAAEDEGWSLDKPSDGSEFVSMVTCPRHGPLRLRRSDLDSAIERGRLRPVRIAVSPPTATS